MKIIPETVPSQVAILDVGKIAIILESSKYLISELSARDALVPTIYHYDFDGVSSNVETREQKWIFLLLEYKMIFLNQLP